MPLLFEDEALKQWDLARLYDDLGKTKYQVSPPSTALTDADKELLCGLLLKLEPREIASRRNVTLGTVKSSLSSTIYRYVKYLTGNENNALNWRDVADWLEESGYRVTDRIDYLGQMPEITNFFYGRQVTLDQLTNRVLNTTCRMVAITGHAGMGKTSLATRLVKKLRSRQSSTNEPFTGGYVWQSLRYSPSLEYVLGDWLTRILQTKPSSQVWYDQLNAVMEYFRENRCLVIIDNLESILDAESIGKYKEEYLPYREFFKRIGEEKHQSCVVITSRYRTPEINGFMDSPVQRIELQGLSDESAKALLLDYKLPESTQKHWMHLIKIYRGNPLMLKMAAQYITELFDKDVRQFLKAKTYLPGDLRSLVGQLLSQLSQDEKEVLKQLSEYDASVPMSKIQHPNNIDAVSTLLNRCLIEKNADGVMPIPVVVDYIRNYLR